MGIIKPAINTTDLSEDNLLKDVALILDNIEGMGSYQLSFIISDYKGKILTHYNQFIRGDLIALCHEAEIPYAFGFEHLGLLVECTQKSELPLHNTEMQLNERLKPLIEKFGVVIFRNAYLSADIIDMCHRNNFPHLNFHRDRGELHENSYSLYTRNPFDALQQYPRKASTLFIDNAVAYLQGKVEKLIKDDEKGRRGHYSIFTQVECIEHLLGDIILEQPWAAPAGVGEICMINNKTVLHSSYKHGDDHGYRIGARYLS
jgi:hypothetical protein